MNQLQQDIAMMIFIWMIVTFMSFGSIAGVDKLYKVKYHMTSVYKLGKIKMMFIFYDRKKGEIAKFAFWLNVVAYIMSIAFIFVFILFVVLQTPIWKFLYAILALGQFGVCLVAGGLDFYYAVRSDKQRRK